jgi:NTE family protein
MFSSRPINTGMAAIRYNLFGRSSAHIDALSYFGKFYAAGQVKLRVDLPPPDHRCSSKPLFNLHRWDHFRSFSTFFDEVKPSFIVIREAFGGIERRSWVWTTRACCAGHQVGETLDSYYQSLDFTRQDTTDVTTWFRQFTTEA